ncbi:hypothetical protein GOV05_02885 [Candidatus Woesearchaeota archaeon]|nr:hypothetical protein [Candidatus Woesearchaeota archaeon]
MRRLDAHIREFSKTIDKDLAEGNQEVFKHAKNFEREIRKEINKLFEITKEDMDLYLLILNSLNEYKKKIYQKTGSDDFGLTKLEVKYAKSNIDSIKDRLKSLNNIFKKLR